MLSNDAGKRLKLGVMEIERRGYVWKRGVVRGRKGYTKAQLWRESGARVWLPAPVSRCICSAAGNRRSLLFFLNSVLFFFFFRLVSVSVWVYKTQTQECGVCLLLAVGDFFPPLFRKFNCSLSLSFSSRSFSSMLFCSSLSPGPEQMKR